MVALAIKGRLEAEGLWRLARGERRVKVRARLSAIADLLDGGAERPSALACPRGAVQHPGIKPGLLLRSQLVRESWPTGLPISAPWRSASSGSATAFLACASFCTGLDLRGFSRAHATPRATPRPRPSSKKSAADGRRGRGGPPRSDIDRTLVPGRDAGRPEKGTLTRLWGRRGQRLQAKRDLGFGYAYLFGAVCPARGSGGAVMVTHSHGNRRGQDRALVIRQGERRRRSPVCRRLW